MSTFDRSAAGPSPGPQPLHKVTFSCWKVIRAQLEDSQGPKKDNGNDPQDTDTKQIDDKETQNSRKRHKTTIKRHKATTKCSFSFGFSYTVGVGGLLPVCAQGGIPS